MTIPTRRTFFKAAGVGVAAIGVAATAAPDASAAAPAASAVAPAPELTLPASAKGAIVAYINDVATGDVAVMVEGREVTVHDPQLVAKLARVLHSTRAV